MRGLLAISAAALAFTLTQQGLPQTMTKAADAKAVPGLPVRATLPKMTDVSDPAKLPPLSLSVPEGLVTGRVQMRALTSDPRIVRVKWYVEGRESDGHNTRPPFEFSYDLGAIPQLRSIRAVAYDGDQNPVYEKYATINIGGRGADIDFIMPISGQQVAGETIVRVKARIPKSETLESIALQYGPTGTKVPLTPKGDDIYEAKVRVPATKFVLSSVAKTNQRSLESNIVLNIPPYSVKQDVDVHVVEQLVKLTGDTTNLQATDFKITDDSGACDVQDVRLVTNAPLSLGIVVDMSQTMRFREDLQQITAKEFVNKVMKPQDTGFVYGFSAFTAMFRDWTNDKDSIIDTLLALKPVRQTLTSLLYDSVMNSLYQFQGRDGSRAVVILSDGYDYDFSAENLPEGSDTHRYHIDYITGRPLEKDAQGKPIKDPRGSKATEKAVLEYAREVGAKIYTIGIQTKSTQGYWYSNPDLAHLSEETQGEHYLVRSPDDLKQAFNGVGDDLRKQYVISFVSKAKRNHSIHPVKIETTRNLKIKTKQEFYY